MAVKVLVMGGTGNGKSTLINALLGKKLLPAREVSCTALAGELKYGEKKQAVLHFRHPISKALTEDLPKEAAQHIKKFSGHVPQLEISLNTLKEYMVFPSYRTYVGEGVFEKLELFYPHPFLKYDMEFMDTPGIENIAALPDYKADVIFFVLNAECFCSSKEMSFIIDYLWSRRKDIFFIVNKYDHIRNEYRDRVQKYVQVKLKVYGGGNNICFVSARDGLEAKIQGDTEKYRSSGMEELQNRLSEFIKEKDGTGNVGECASNRDVFSWENFDEFTDFENHLAFLEMMIHKYKWEPDIKTKLTARLKKIKAKQQDEKLNLSVIGDFSTGKSTFINALLRMELLMSGSVQGTTTVSTIMEYSRDYGIKLRYKDKSKESFQFDNMQELKDKLSTLNPETAQKLHHVRIYLPSESLAQNIRMVDTPGTNAIEEWHEEVTVRTISEFSDLSIILINASKPLPATFCHFIENHLSHILEQCVFVVTKFDLLKKKEREKVITYIRQKLEKIFGLQEPLIFPYVAPYVIDDFMGDTSLEDVPELLKMSYENEEAIFCHMAKQRVIIQTKKLIALEEDVYGMLSEHMKEISDSCQNYLELLRKTRKVDLGAFVSAQKKERNLSYERAIKEKRAEIVKYFDELSASAQKNIFAEIDKKLTVNELKSYLENQLENDCVDETRKMAEKAERRFSGVTECFQVEMLLFQEKFKKLYQDLEILKIDFSGKKHSLPKTADKPGNTVMYAIQELSKENKTLWGTAAAGAAVGTLIAPGVGTIIGGIAGLFMGGSSEPDIDEVRKSSKEKLAIPLHKYFGDMTYGLTAALDEYIDKVKADISGEIDRYLVDYKEIIAKRIEEEKCRRASMEDRLKTIRMDMESIEKRKFRIKSVSEQIGTVNKG